MRSAFHVHHVPSRMTGGLPEYSFADWALSAASSALPAAFSADFAAAAALAAAYGPSGFGGPLYPFPRTVNDYTHALLRHDPLGKAAGAE